MTVRVLRFLPAAAVLCLCACGQDASDRGTVSEGGAAPPDALYVNGRVYTVNGESTWASAFSVTDGEFVSVGSDEALRAQAGATTAVTDLAGRFVMPGIHDMHAHPMEAGLKDLYQCSFPFTLSVDEIVEKLKGCVEGVPEGEWIRGGQWATELMGSETVPHRSILDAVTKAHPVFLGDSAVHGAWLNSKALELLGIDRDTPAPNGGVILKDADGEPTGILLDNAVYMAMRRLPAYAPEEYEAAVEYAVERMNEVGVTAMKDALVDGYTMRAYHALDQNGRLNMKVAASLAWNASWSEPREKELENIDVRTEYKSANVDNDFIKIFLDGIPPTRTAAMLDPYVADDAHGDDFRGKLIHTPEDLAADVVSLDAQGLAVKIHATGDRSLRVALDAFEAARNKNGDSGQIHEVSHAELIHPDDLPRFAELNVAAEMCPILWYPSPLVEAMEQVIGKERADRFWPVKSLGDAGALVFYGSDWPSVVPDPSPWPGIEAMVTRRDPYGERPGELGSDQAVDLETAIEIFTRNGARVARLEDRTGSIEAGKSADFIVLDRNPFEIPVEQISDVKVLKTVVGGVPVFEAE